MRIARRLHERSEEIVRHIDGVIADGIEGLDAPEAAELLHLSVEANVSTIVRALREQLALEDLGPLGPAEEYARFLAREGVSSVALRRAYHFGSDDLISFVFEEVQAVDVDTTTRLHVLHHVSSWLHRYIDWVTTAILAVYDDEVRVLADLRADRVTGVVQEVLAGADVASDAFLSRTGYRLDQAHLAALLWVDSANSGVDQTARLEAASREIARSLGATGFVLSAVDRTSSRVWFGSPAGSELTAATGVADVGDADLRAAFGVTADGIDGFRTSLAHAEGAASVIRASRTRRVLSADQEGVALVSQLVRDLPALRAWTDDILGDLAADTPAAADMRATIATYLATNGSLLATAERLHVHRNTVRYRVQKAEQDRGESVEHRRIDLELALKVIDLLGAVPH